MLNARLENPAIGAGRADTMLRVLECKAAAGEALEQYRQRLATVAGEPLEIYPFLGSSRLAEVEAWTN